MQLTRSPTGLRLYSESQLATRLGLPLHAAARRVVAYCRVSSAVQKPDLCNQRRALEEFRFGFDWFEHFARVNGCELLVLNQERLPPEQEMVQDIITIVHCFSSRLDGLRNYRQLDAALTQDASHVAGPSNQA